MFPLSLESDTMSPTIRYSTIESYRALEPELRVSYPGDPPSLDSYLEQFDQEIAPQPPPILSRDLVSLVFSNQAATHSANSRQLATLILEREKVARKHLRDIQWRMSEFQSQRPQLIFSGARPVDLMKLEQQIAELDRQKREVELGLWQDILELRKDLHEERREYRATRNRMTYISGGGYGSG